MANLIYKDLSYKVVGILYKVYNELGGGYQEKYYQKAIAVELEKQKIKYQEQLKVNLDFSGVPIGKYYLDFLVENKIILEIKVGPKFYQRDIKQVLGYLKSSGFKLGILALFSKSSLQYKRLVC